MPNFNWKSDVFSDISDEEIVNANQDVENIERFLKYLQQKDLDDLIRKGLSKNTESKCKWALNLFCKMATLDRKKGQPNADSFMFKDIMNDEEIDRCLIFFVVEVKNKSGEESLWNNLFDSASYEKRQGVSSVFWMTKRFRD